MPRPVAYPVRYYQDGDGGWNAEFPGLEGCLTCGESLDEVKANALEALNGYLESLEPDQLAALEVPMDWKGAFVTPALAEG